MTDPEVTANLEAVLAGIRPDDQSIAQRALTAWTLGDLVSTHTLVLDIAWGYWRSDLAPPAPVYPLQEELAARRRAARGAIGRPHDFQAPSRYGHLQG